MRSEFEKLLAVSLDDEVNLWFEYELFCQANLWFCLSLLTEKEARIYRVAPVIRNENDLWKGFGGLSEDDLKKCFEQRIRLSKDDINFGNQFWKAFSTKDFQSLKHLSFEKCESFPSFERNLRSGNRHRIAPEKKNQGNYF